MCVVINLDIGLIKIGAEIILKKIPPYSAMKIKANKPEPYSILKSDTNSDSPPEKSNGVRLVSAIQEITHSREMNGITKRRERNLENFIISSTS